MTNRLFLLLCLVLFWGCSNDPGLDSASAESIDPSVDFVEIHSAGKKVTLGTDDSTAVPMERPAMQVSLEQNFFMGKHEVTCGKFNDVMKKVSGLQVKCEDKNLPATNVTFFDAVLYANAESKAEKWDTVYTYKQTVYDEQRNCINLEGFAFHPEKEGFRLPTEAEWVYVAKQNWGSEGEWLSGNSKGKLHAVCSYEGAGEICDMVGNVKEWVGDWMGSFQDSTVSNYVGASDGGALGERVLKGGYYLQNTSSANLFSRGDVYVVTSATKTDYVGFRLAYGAIPGAVWINSNGSMENSPVVPLANSSTIRSLLGSFKTKIAFRNDVTGNLSYIDYSLATASVVEIRDTMEVYHPDISPDGLKVAFCTGLEGVSGKSSLYVRSLDSEGSGLVKLDVESAAIPRWRVIDGDTVIVYVSDAGTNKNEADFMKKSTWMVPFSAGAFGTPVKLFDGAYHDGVSEDLKLAVTGSSLLRVKKAKRSLLENSSDTVWYDGEQACNASLAMDGSKRVAFLDFGGKAGKRFVGHSYKAHEFLLVVDSAGKLIQKVEAPAGYTFDHAEWVSGFVKRKGFLKNNFVSATLTNVNGAHPKIVLVDVESGSVTELAESEELWHPCVWVRSGISDDENVQIDYDSAGVYFVDGGTDRTKILRYRMETFWKYKDSTEIIGLGSSRTSNGFDPLYLKSAKNPINLAYFYSTFHDIYDFYYRYVRHNAKNLKYLLISVDIDFWFTGSGDSFFNTEYKDYPGYVYDENHNYWRNSDYSLISEATNDGVQITEYQNIFGNNRSSLFNKIMGWESDNPELEQDSCWMDGAKRQFEETFGRFKDLLRMFEEDSLVSIGVIFPQSPGYKNMGTFGRHGMRRSDAAWVIPAIENLQSEFPHFIFMDENKMGNHDYTDDMAQDADHLAPLGAKQFTERLDSLVRTLKPLR